MSTKNYLLFSGENYLSMPSAILGNRGRSLYILTKIAIFRKSSASGTWEWQKDQNAILINLYSLEVNYSLYILFHSEISENVK